MTDNNKNHSAPTPPTEHKPTDDYLASFALDLNAFMLSPERLKLPLMAQIITDSIRDGGKLITMGNGGSSAQAMHLATEFVGRFSPKLLRSPFPALPLGTDPTLLTALANDYGTPSIFNRQLTALAKPGDTLLALSTSGESQNTINALYSAKELNLHTLGLSGYNGGRMAKFCDLCLSVPSQHTPHIQEIHSVCCHILITLIEDALTMPW